MYRCHLRDISQIEENQTRRWNKLTQTGLVVHIWISEVEVPMSFPIIELNSNCVVCFLIHRPDSASEVQA